MQTYKGNKNSSEKYSQAIRCTKCKQIVVAELDPKFGDVALYNFGEPINQKKVLHEHPADNVTISRVSKRVAAEKRLLEEVDSHDWVYHDTDNGVEDTK